MAKKRKSEASRLDEVDGAMYSAFRGAANSLSQLYTHAMNHQRLSFLAGERHALEKLYQWIVRQQEEGTKASTIDIITYLQNELEYEPEELPISPRLEVHQLQHQHQHQIAPSHVNNSIMPVSSSRLGHYDSIQAKGSIFSNGLSSPVRRTLQHFQLAEPCNHHVTPQGSGESMDIPADNRGQDLSF